MSLDPVVEKIITARVSLLMRQPFFGNMATRLKLKECSDWCKTAATDGRHLYYNREFFADMSIREVEFVIAHEILHNAFEHMARNEGRDRQLWNIAADYCVNGQLVRDNIGSVPSKIKIFHDTAYYGKSAEEIYDELYDNAEKIPAGSLLDEHIDWSQSGDGDQSDRPVYSKEELAGLRDEVRESMLQAAAAAAGKVPAGIQRLIKDFTESKIGWRELLRQQIQSIVRSDYSFTRPSRKGWHTGAILPGTKFAEAIDLCIAIDMSGSISNAQASEFLGEIHGIMEQFPDYQIKVWSFDTDIYNVDTFSGQDGRSIIEYEPVGGGGTDFQRNWEFMQDEGIEPKRFIMFTDGYPCGSWGDANYCDTVFVIHGNDSIVPPFGEYAYFPVKG